MTIWCIAQELPTHDSATDAARQPFLFDANGLPDLARAQSGEHLKEWLFIALPQAVPEYIHARAEYLWTLSHGIGESDFILIEEEGGKRYRLGEVSGPYRYESQDGNYRHSLPVRWLDTAIPAADMSMLARHFKPDGIAELADPDAIGKLQRYIPSLRRRGTVLFRWVGIVILLFELIYFWPH